VDLDSLNPASWLFDDGVSTKVRVWLYVSFFLSFCAIGGAIWIMAAVYMPPHNSGNQVLDVKRSQTKSIFSGLELPSPSKMRSFLSGIFKRANCC
jgi:hypothetical protein